MNLVHAIISFLLMTKKCNTTNKAETWRCIILTSQKCFPTPTIKSATTVLLNDMLVSNFNIQTNDSIHLYGATYIPIVSHADELIAKLVSYSHNPSMLVIGGSARFHRPLNLTVGKTMSGKFAVLTTNMNRIASEAIASCPPCLKM